MIGTWRAWKLAMLLWGVASAYAQASSLESRQSPAAQNDSPATPQTSLSPNYSPEQVRAHFEDQVRKLGNAPSYAATLNVYKAWSNSAPQDKIPKEKLLLLLADGKQYDAVNTFNQPHFDAPDERFSGQLMIALGMYFSLRDEEAWTRAEKIVRDTRKEFIPKFSRFGNGPFGSGWNAFRGSSAQMGLAGALELEARLLFRKGNFRQALSISEEGIDAAREALDIVKDMPPTEAATAAAFQSKETLANLLLQKIRAQVANGSTRLASLTLDEYLPLSREVEKHPRYFWNLAVSEYNQRDFVRAQSHFQQADIAAQSMGYQPLSFFRTDCAQGFVGTLEGQNKWDEAKAELERLDALAGDDETLKYRVRIRSRFERSLAFIQTGVRLEEALVLLQEVTTQTNDQLFSAHAMGLRGVALWQLGQDPVIALKLLKNAVEIYMTPLYFDDQALGLNANVRDLVIETYLEALFQSDGESLMSAIGPAEWVRSSVVQSALSDAAIRSATKDPALSELVRNDQDLKNQIRNLKSKAALEFDAAINSQINDLNILRLEIQEKIKLKFPEYDKLVAPNPPDPNAALKELAPDEALVLLMPTEKSVFVWAITAEEKNTALRVKMPKGELSELVRELRKSLDLSEMGGSLAAFNFGAASEIYQRFLAPLNSSIAGKKHLIIAAGGVLGQIPFGVLLSDQKDLTGKGASFLIKQYAISHVPSISAWLAVKKFAETQRAPEALAAWGDPSFGLVASAPAPERAKVRHLSLTRSQPHAINDGLATPEEIHYTDIPPLPETRDELLAIANALQANPLTDLHLGNEATKASVMQVNATGELALKKVVIFATHGLMAGDLPHLNQPALALANTGGLTHDLRTNLLLLEDVLGMKLNADWVVLSACNTAAADGKVEEAMSGLTRGFFYAGSRSLLVTHWAVETESAKLLTTKTFVNYTANPNERKAESLRQAMLAVMAIPEYAHPAYWGPYALVGDGGR